MRQGDLDVPHDRRETEVIAGLRQIGYRGPLLEEGYAFPDWFEHKAERRSVAVAFAETPTSYESACIGVARSNGLREQALVNGYRALGAPILLEIDSDEIREWAVSRFENRHILIARYPSDQISSAFAQRALNWKRDAVLRSKNIGSFRWTKQLSMFSGLIPELESQVQDQLDPLLRDTLSATRGAYVESTGRPPSDEHLFKLVFWILTAKVFHDRKVPGFASLSPDPDTLLTAVAKHYGEDVPRLLNRQARETAATHAWDDLDFRNLSVEVLSQIWSKTLVDKETRRRLGIHRTSRTIVRYIIERIPFSPSGDDDKRVVFEPCSGSAAFLIGAMHALRQNLFGASSAERHEYFVKHLAGLEYDPFGVEISNLALTLADFPNPKGWKMEQRDVFVPGTMTEMLRLSGVVLCNPPFEKFDLRERAKHQPQFLMKPAELLRLVLEDLHPSGVLGFVLPYVAVDGKAYKPIRELLASRFASLELTVLPDRAFQEADAEVALLIAKEPIPHDVCRVTFRRVDDNAAAWERFEHEHEVSTDHSLNFGTEAARRGFTIPALHEVWSFLIDYPRLSEVAEIHRGLEWHTRSKFVRTQPAEGYMLGVPPRSHFNVFEVPAMRYLSIRQEDQRRNAWQHPWNKPKAIFNKSTRSRGRWRLSAFPDQVGVTCFQTYNAAWPKTQNYDEVLLAAILNSPIANAFVSTREGKTDNTVETLRSIPIPVFTPEQRERLKALVSRYQGATEATLMPVGTDEDPELLLKQIDAAVLDGYRMPPNLERQVLDFFNGQERPIAHEFSDYVPADHETYFSLSQIIDRRFLAANVGELLRGIEDRQRTS